MKPIFIKKLLTVLLVTNLSIFNTAQANTNINDASLNSSEVFIFISFSMPTNSLKAWFSQAQKIHASIVIRGLVNDYFGDTQKAVKTMINDQSGGVVLDPRLFQQYHITQVPAVVVRHPLSNSCLPNQSCWRQENVDVIVGDVGLESALKMIADKGDNAQTAQKLLASWRST